MSLTPELKTILLNEINNDPESLGYAGKTNAEIAAIMNTPGTASLPNRVPIASDIPIIKTGAELMAIVMQIDGQIDPLNIEGVGLARLLDWIDRDSDPMAAVIRYFFSSSAQLDVASNDVRSAVDYLRGVEVQPGNRTLISEEAMNTLFALGMILMSRAKEITSQPVTESMIAEALAP